MASALALGHDGPRLRSRRYRSGRSHRLSWALVVTVTAIASLVGFVGAKFQLAPLVQSTPVADAATLEQQRFAGELRPIRTQLQASVASLGLAVSAYESGEIDRAELQRRLSGVLSSYQAVADEVDTLDAPSGEETIVGEYVATVTELTQSVVGLSKAYDDGDQSRVAQALAVSLQAVAQLHALSPAPA
jgi:hypothetical protein